MEDSQNKKSPEEQKADVFANMFIKLGIKLDEKKIQNLHESFKPFSAQMEAIKKSSNMKGTFWDSSILTGVTKQFNNLIGNTKDATNAMIGLGLASKAGVGDPEFYKDMTMSGKLLVNLAEAFGGVGAGAEGAAVGVESLLAAIGPIGWAVAAIAAIAAGLAYLGSSIMTSREEMVKFDKIFNGSEDTLKDITKAINNTSIALLQNGFAFGRIRDTIYSYLKNGLGPAIAANQKLIETTMRFGIVTGENEQELAGFYSELIKGTKISVDSIEHMNSSFAQFNQNIKIGSVIGAISFSQFKEAVNSASTALAIASSKGKAFTDKMGADLVSLTGLANTLGLSVSDINSKFEETSNILNSPTSGFRNLLVLSKGANLKNLLEDSFNRTEATIKSIEFLQNLNNKFGGNLSVTAQIAERNFGLSKDQAVRLINTSQEQIRAIRQQQEDLKRLRDPALEDAFNKVTNTLGQTWQKLKNTLFTIFQDTIANNPDLHRVLDKISHWVQELFNAVTGKRAQTVLNTVSNFVSKIAKFIEYVFDNAEKWFTSIGDWIGDLANPAGDFSSKFNDMMFDFGMTLGKGFLAGMAKASLDFSLAGIFTKWLGSKLGGGSYEEVTGNSLKRMLPKDEYLDENERKSKYVDVQQQRLSGIKDTEVVFDPVTKSFISAGQRKAALDKEKEELEKKKLQYSERLTNALNNLADTINGKRGKEVTEKTATSNPSPASYGYGAAKG